MFFELRPLARRHTFSVLGLLLVGGISACRGETPAEARSVRTRTEPIVFGRPSPPGTREDAVLMLRVPFEDAELSCSAALVAKNLVLTVRHCVSYSTEGGAACTLRGELLDDGSGGGHLGLHVPSEDLEFYSGDGDARRLVARGARTLSTVSETICIDDLAFVVLDRDLDLPILPMRTSARARLGEAVTLVGYGLDENMGFDTELDDLVRRAKDDLEILDVGPSSVDEVTSAPPRSILVRAPAGCVGDSGGPLIATASGAILGAYSVLIGESCTSTAALNLFPHVPDYQVLLADAFEAAGATPLPEPIPGEFGEVCETDSDCALDLCRDLGGEQRCTERCERSRDCADGYVCSAATDGYCVPEPPAMGAAGASTSGEGSAGAAGQAPSEAGPRARDGGCSVGRSTSPPVVLWGFVLWGAARLARRPTSSRSAASSSSASTV